LSSVVRLYTLEKTKGQSRIENSETRATLDTRNRTKTKKTPKKPNDQWWWI